MAAMGTRRRLTPRQAADQLGVSVEAVRGRIKRGTIPHERHGNRVVVILDADQTATGHDQGGDQTRPDARDELVEEMGERIEDLRRQLDQAEEARRRADTIIMQLTQTNAALAARLPELEASPAHETPQKPEIATEASEGTTPQPEREEAEEPAQPRPWWRRMFGG